MSEIDQTAEELFSKLRNRFPRIRMGDADGKDTGVPSDARFFNLRYDFEGTEFGEITCSLVDGESLKIYFSQDMTEEMDEAAQDDWFAFLRELRKFAKANMLMFDVRDINKPGLTQQDIEFSSNYHKDKSDVNESKITWQRRGRFSEGNQKNVRIHVVHKNKLDENPNNRLVQVDKIYLVNENNERFLLPFTSVMGAKAMANHVNRGGTPYDESGQIIGRAIAEMKNLSRFQMATRNKTFESQDPYRVIRATQLVKEEMRKHLKKMAGSRNFEEGLNALQEMLQEHEAPQTDTIKNYFIQQYYNESLDAWLGSAAMAYKRCEDNNMDLNQDIPLTEDEDDFKDQTAKRAANPAHIGNSVELYANPHTDAEMRKLLKSQPLRGMISLILADIASRAVDDETAILASKADTGEFTVAHKKMIEAYLKDLFSENPPRQGESERRTINYPKQRKTAEEEYESAIMGIGEEEMDEDPINDKVGQFDREQMNTAATNARFSDKTGNVPTPPARPVPTPPERPASLGGKEDPTMGGAIPNTGMRTIQETDCNHTMEGEYCPVHGMNECGMTVMPMNEDIMDLRRLSGLAECGDDGMMSGIAGNWLVMGAPHDTAAVQRGSAEMDRAKRLEQAIADKANADAEAQTNWVIDQIRAQPVWAPPNLEQTEDAPHEVGAKPHDNHPHADQAHPQHQEQDDDDEEEFEISYSNADDEDESNHDKDGDGKEEVETDEVADRDPRHRFRSLRKAKNKLGEVETTHDVIRASKPGDPDPRGGVIGDTTPKELSPDQRPRPGGGTVASPMKEADGHKPDADGDGVPDWADKKPGKDDNEETDESREFYEAMRDMRRLSGLDEQTLTSPESPGSNITNTRDPFGQGLDKISAARWNAQAARNRAAEKAFYDANPHLVGDTATMQKLRDQGKLDFNPGTLSKTFNDPEVDPVFAQNRAAVDAAKKQRYREIDTAKSQAEIDKIQSQPAWTPDSEPWQKKGTTAPTVSKSSVDTPASSSSPNKPSNEYIPGQPMNEGDGINLLRKLAGL